MRGMDDHGLRALERGTELNLPVSVDIPVYILSQNCTGGLQTKGGEMD